MKEMMRALQIAGPGIVEEILEPIPEIAEDEALIRIVYSGLCATDYEILGGEMSLIKEGKIRYPVRFGHEYSGVIVKVGSAVKNLRVGDHVLSDSGVSCGKCPACLEGRYSDCKHGRSVGTVNCWPGSFAEYMHVPERHLFKLPDDLDMKECALIEPSCIALEGLKRAGDLQGKTVVVVGTGAIGLTTVAMAKHFKPGKLILAGRTDGKLEVGKQLGATHVVNIRKEDLKEALLRENDGMGADVVMETSGNPDAVNQCVLLARYAGTVVFTGFYDRPADGFPIDIVVSNKLTVAGVMGDYGTPAEVIRIVEEDKINFRPIITHIISLDEVRDALLHPEKLEGTRIKVLARISGEE